MDGLGWLLLSLVLIVLAFIRPGHNKKRTDNNQTFSQEDAKSYTAIETGNSKIEEPSIVNEEILAEDNCQPPTPQNSIPKSPQKRSSKRIIKFKYTTEGIPEIKEKFAAESIETIKRTKATSEQLELFNKLQDHREKIRSEELTGSSTDLCYLNEEERDIIIFNISFDRKKDKGIIWKKGLFKLDFPNGETIAIPDATHFWKCHYENDIAIIGSANDDKIYHISDLYNMIFYIWQLQNMPNTSDYGKKLFNLYIYKGPNLIDKIENICPTLDLSKSPGRFCFFRPLEDSADEDDYEQYLYNFGEKILLARGHRKIYSTGHWAEPSYNSLKLYKSLKNKEEYDITEEDDYIKIFFFVNGCKASYILKEFCKAADELKKLPNPFPDDATENYMAKFKKTRVDDLKFVHFCFMMELFGMRPSFAGYGLYFTSVENYAGSIIDYKYPVDSDFWKLTDEEYNSGKQMLKDLYKYSSNSFSENHFPPDMPYLYITSKIQMKYLLGSIPEITKEDRDRYKEKYNAIYQSLLDKGEIKAKWKSEFNLYQIVAKIYPDAIYQYHSSWLGGQSLDVYVPSIRTGFEYQGIQHYQPVDYFGGEESFKKNVERDARKKELCKENCVKLIEIRYDETLTANKVKSKIDALS